MQHVFSCTKSAVYIQIDFLIQVQSVYTNSYMLYQLFHSSQFTAFSMLPMFHSLKASPMLNGPCRVRHKYVT